MRNSNEKLFLENHDAPPNANVSKPIIEFHLSNGRFNVTHH